MRIAVLKFGGSSVANPEKIMRVAEKVVATKKKGYDVVVVVSAMGDTTDNLLSLARSINPNPHRRELDMLLSVGERISMSLLSMAIGRLGYDSISLTGSQSGIITNDSHNNARIIEIRPFRIQDELEKGKIVIVAGYQGVSYRKEITTLGRGGSDTTAVALAAALDAEYCEIYSDVDGVYSADPKVVDKAERIDHISYQSMQEYAEAGARVLNSQAVEFAKKKGIAIYCKSTFSDGGGTIVDKFLSQKSNNIIGVTYEEKIILLQKRFDSYKEVQVLFEILDAYKIVGKQIRFERDNSGYFLSLAFSDENIHDFGNFKTLISERFGNSVVIREDTGTVSLIGDGINHDYSNMRNVLDILNFNRVELIGVTTSSFRISAIIPSYQVKDTVRALHKFFIEERK
ncbi:MAG: aspartate kinase [Deltaproteobacteria bacterium]|nr:aspartate kinase [Deltaproteobacteria bacterium]